MIEALNELKVNWEESAKAASHNGDEEAAGIFNLCAGELECVMNVVGSDKVEYIGV